MSFGTATLSGPLINNIARTLRGSSDIDHCWNDASSFAYGYPDVVRTPSRCSNAPRRRNTLRSATLDVRDRLQGAVELTLGGIDRGLRALSERRTSSKVWRSMIGGTSTAITSVMGFSRPVFAFRRLKR